MTNKFKAIIVDDEKLARLDLRNVLSTFEEFEIIGEANNVSSAELLIKKLHPNLVFLDVQLRGESGFNLLEKIDFPQKGGIPELDFVFVTAYDKYAFRAFDVNALDYLLKPVSTERIRQMIDKLIYRRSGSIDHLNKLNYDDAIFLMLNNKYSFLKISSITAITSNADYSFIYTDEKSRYVTRKTMKEWEGRLPENHFCRIHRETIVNLSCISNMGSWLSKSNKVHLNGIEQPFLISRRYAAKIKKRFV